MTANRTPAQMRETLAFWDRNYAHPTLLKKQKMTGPGSLTHRYLQLCAISRRLEDCTEHDQALKLVRPVRLTIEGEVRRRWEKLSPEKQGQALFRGDLFGSSSKQGVSFRLGLESCQPTKMCATRCYAHDGNDCLPQPVLRGALNSIIAQEFESGNWDAEREGFLFRHTRRAARMAVREMLQAREGGFLRAPRIRFSHVGDIAKYPGFANQIGAYARYLMYQSGSDSGVPKSAPVIVTYTRRAADVMCLSKAWTILCSYDSSTLRRSATRLQELREMVRGGLRLAWCAFDGRANHKADVTFAEHHGPRRLPTMGSGFVCPSTRKSNPIHGCDANRCDFCFRPM